MTSDTALTAADFDDMGGNLWDYARREYLSGMTAASICQRYGVSLSSFRMHARIGGWRRIDQPACDVTPEAGEYHPDDNVGFVDLADQAFLNIRRALGMGRASEAATWMRVYDKLCDRARAQVMSALPDSPPPASLREPLRLSATEDANTLNVLAVSAEAVPQELDSLHPVFSESNQT